MYSPSLSRSPSLEFLFTTKIYDKTLHVYMYTSPAEVGSDGTSTTLPPRDVSPFHMVDVEAMVTTSRRFMSVKRPVNVNIYM